MQPSNWESFPPDFLGIENSKQIFQGSPTFTTYPLVNDHIAGWTTTIFIRKYIFNPGSFSIAMLVYQRVPHIDKTKTTRFFPMETPPSHLWILPPLPSKKRPPGVLKFAQLGFRNGSRNQAMRYNTFLLKPLGGKGEATGGRIRNP